MSTWRHPLFRPDKEWIAVPELGKPGTDFIEGPCSHRSAVCVDSTVTGEIIAKLCPNCDRQLPADWTPDIGLSGRHLSSRYFSEARRLMEAAERQHQQRCDVCARNKGVDLRRVS